MSLEQYRGVGLPSPGPAADENPLLRAIDLANRPASAIFGGIRGALDPNLDVTEGVRQGWMGERQFGGSDLLELAGAEEGGALATYGGLLLDVVNPLDPLSYLTLGWNKVGRVARSAAKLGIEGELAAKAATRAAAAQEGYWGLINLGGKTVPLGPVNVGAAKAVDRVAGLITESAAYQKVREYVGGVSWKLEQSPELRGALQQLKEMRMGSLEARQGDTDAVGALLEKVVAASGGDTKKANRLFREIAPLMENSEATVARLRNELMEVDAAGARQGVGWVPWQGYTPEELDAVKRAAMVEQENVGLRLNELEMGIASARSEGRVHDAETLANEHFILKSMKIDPEDVPPLDFLHQRRAELSTQLDQATGRRSGQVAEAYELERDLRPFIAKAQGILKGVLDQYDAVDLPLEEDYLPHLLPAQSSKLTGWLKTRKTQQVVMAEAVKDGFKGEELAKETARRMKELEDQSFAVDRGVDLRGTSDRFKRREYRMDIQAIKEAKKRGEISWDVEDHTGYLAMNLLRDMRRFEFAHDVHAWARKQDGWTMTREEWAGLSKEAQAEWVDSDFRLPFVDPKKDPFRSLMFKRDEYGLMKGMLESHKLFTTEKGENALIAGLNAVRRFWSAWTLAPLPSYHLRNLVSDFVLMHEAGLNPVTDLARAAGGKKIVIKDGVQTELEDYSAQLASMAFAMKNSGVPFTDKAFAGGPKSLENFFADVSAQTGEKFDFDVMRNYLKRDQIIGEGDLRDLDLEAVMSSDQVRSAMALRDWRDNARDLVRLDPKRNLWVQKGFKEGRKLQEMTKTALWVHSFREAMEAGAGSVEAAANMAASKTRWGLFDYADLTDFEKTVVKPLVPFWTFMSKNMPHQLGMAVTQPGKLAWAMRAYEGLWGTAEEEGLDPEDLPEYIRNAFGAIVETDHDEEGRKRVYTLSPMGWIPLTDANEIAELLRTKGRSLIPKLNPALKEPLEQALNIDAFTGEQMASGQVRDMFGIPMSPRVQHFLRNARILNEFDKLNPGGLWTKIAQATGLTTAERPHRKEASGAQRALKALLGTDFAGFVPEEELQKSMKMAAFSARKSETMARLAMVKGAGLEAQSFLEQAQQQREEMAALARRLNKTRQMRAIKDLGR